MDKKIDSIIGLDNLSVTHLSEAVKIQTISDSDISKINKEAFLQFRAFLEKSYPLIHSQLERTIINDFSYIYYWRGLDESLPPYILMAHSDVVPAENPTESFSGEIKDNSIWGRGTNDDKGNLISILEAAEKLLNTSFKPKRDFYFCFGHTEEVNGQEGAPAIVNWLESKNIKPDLALDEGGFITKEYFKELNRPIALLGVCEKGYVTFELSVKKDGGHSSTPESETAIDILSKAIANLRKNSTRPHLTKPMRLMLKIIGSKLGFVYRIAVANLWLFENSFFKKFEASSGMNASIRTTIVPTIISAGLKDNVIPSEAKAIINCRVIPGETINDVSNFIKENIKDRRVEIKIQKNSSEPSEMTPVESIAYKTIEEIASKIMENVLPVPFLMVATTDSKYYRKISNSIINFSPMLDPKGYHGKNENLTFDDFKRMIYFYELILTK